jgi:hypothetical protein
MTAVKRRDLRGVQAVLFLPFAMSDTRINLLSPRRVVLTGISGWCGHITGNPAIFSFSRNGMEFLGDFLKFLVKKSELLTTWIIRKNINGARSYARDVRKAVLNTLLISIARFL